MLSVSPPHYYPTPAHTRFLSLSHTDHSCYPLKPSRIEFASCSPSVLSLTLRDGSVQSCSPAPWFQVSLVLCFVVRFNSCRFIKRTYTFIDKYNGKTVPELTQHWLKLVLAGYDTMNNVIHRTDTQCGLENILPNHGKSLNTSHTVVHGSWRRTRG